MSPESGYGTRRKLAIVLLLLLTPVLAFFLIAGALTTDAGPVGWLSIVVAPLTLLGIGLYAMTDDAPDWLRRTGERA